jgi:plasmid stabilization system protein ParE
MEVRLTPRVHAEVAEIVEWYEAHAPHVVPRFMAAYGHLLAHLDDNPSQSPRARGKARRAGFHDFPYGLFYRIKADEVEVFACLHAKRHPTHWQRRQ